MMLFLRLLKLLFRRPLRHWWALAGLVWRVLGGAWVAPSTQVTDHLVTADEWNILVNDILYLFNGRGYGQYIVNEGADYTWTSTTFVTIDNTDLALTVNVKSGMALCFFHGSVGFSATNQSIILNITRGGNDIGFSGGFAVARSGGDATLVMPISILVLATGLSSGNHIFRLTGRTNTGTATLYASAGTADLNQNPVFGVIEVGNG